MSLVCRSSTSSYRLAVASLHQKARLHDRYALISDFFRRQSLLSQKEPHQSVGKNLLLPFRVDKAPARSFHSTPKSYSSAHDQPPKPPNTVPPEPLIHSGTEHNYSRFFQRLSKSLPHTQRHTVDDFLRVANGFWQRLRIRFKWFTIKSFREFNADDISAFVTWFLMSQTLWIFVGT